MKSATRAAAVGTPTARLPSRSGRRHHRAAGIGKAGALLHRLGRVLNREHQRAHRIELRAQRLPDLRQPLGPGLERNDEKPRGEQDADDETARAEPAPRGRAAVPRRSRRACSGLSRKPVSTAAVSGIATALAAPSAPTARIRKMPLTATRYGQLSVGRDPQDGRSRASRKARPAAARWRVSSASGGQASSEAVVRKKSAWLIAAFTAFGIVGLGDQEGRLRPLAGQQPLGEGGDEDHRHLEHAEDVAHRVEPGRAVGELDVGEHQARRVGAGGAAPPAPRCGRWW